MTTIRVTFQDDHDQDFHGSNITVESIRRHLEDFYSGTDEWRVFWIREVTAS